MTANVPQKHNEYYQRLHNLETERRAAADAIKDLTAEMKSQDLHKHEIAGIKLAVRRSFEDQDKREARESAEQVAEALGDLSDTPLGNAALRAVS